MSWGRSTMPSTTAPGYGLGRWPAGRALDEIAAAEQEVTVKCAHCPDWRVDSTGAGAHSLFREHAQVAHPEVAFGVRKRKRTLRR
jgi:hypothetical protein